MFTFAWLALDIAGEEGMALWSGFTVDRDERWARHRRAGPARPLVWSLRGILTDRLDRRVLLFGTQLVGIGLAAGAATLVALGTLNIWGIFGLAFVLGCTTAFGMPVRQAIVPSLVSPERVLNAVTLMNVSAQVAQAGRQSAGS